MIRFEFVNDGTGDLDIGSYDYTVTVNGHIIATGRVEGHDWHTGWEGLVEDLFISLQVADLIRNDG